MWGESKGTVHAVVVECTSVIAIEPHTNCSICFRNSTLNESVFIHFLEFIQTEMHHVRTLKILLHVYMYELRQSLLIEEARLERLFFGVDVLLNLHQHFLTCLKARQNESQEEGIPNTYRITQFGDILISQVG